MTNDQSKKLRLAVWTIAAAGAGVGQAIWLEWMKVQPTARIGWRFDLVYGGVIGCLAAIILLLYTTPANAIRLQRWVSELIILAVVIAMALPGAKFLPAAVARLLFLLPTLIFLRIKEKSPWWAVAIAWFPIMQ